MKKKVVLLSVAAVVLVGAIVVGCVALKNSRMWENQLALVESTPESEVLEYFTSESAFVYDMEDFKKKLEEKKSSENDLNSAAEEWKKTAEPIPDDYEKLFEETNEKIASYFSDKAGVSVEDKLKACEIKQVDIPNEYGVGAYYSFDEKGNGNIIYFDSDNFDNPVTEFDKDGNYAQSLYIHEVVHYLGFNDPNNRDVSLLMEGFVAALTYDIWEYSGLSSELNIELYVPNIYLARQMMAANKDLVKTIISADKKGDIALFDELCRVLGEERAKHLCDMHFLLNTKYASTDADILNVSQYLTAEYCKSFELTDKEILEIYKQFIAPVSAI